MRFIGILGLLVLFLGCNNTRHSKYKSLLVGDWRIENPTLQSFIRFQENGEVVYFFNRFSYELDSLNEFGKWSLDKISKGKQSDTLVITIAKKPQNTVFKFIFIDKDRIKVIDERGQTFFSRIQNQSNN